MFMTPPIGMSLMGHKRMSAGLKATSALHLLTDIGMQVPDVGD
jgi:hypothetical protein